MLTTNHIQSRLLEVAQKRGIRLLFAVESGSRAWGMASPDSDYDVRFVYAKSVDDYLSLENDKEMIGPIMEQDGELDLVGWDIRKFLKHIVQSNPNVLEWLNSPIHYFKQPGIFEQLDTLADMNFCPHRTVAHYLGIARGAYHAGYENEQWNLKEFGYYLRPILAAHYVNRTQQRNPISFDALRSGLYPGKINEWIDAYLEQKKHVEEKFIAPIDPQLAAWTDDLRQALEAQKKMLPKQIANYAAGNELFRSLLRHS